MLFDSSMINAYYSSLSDPIISPFNYSWELENHKYILSLDVPGFSKDEVSVKSKQGKVIVSLLPAEGNKRKAMSGSFLFPKECDLTKITAELENGVLEVCVPEKENPENKEISVKIT